MKWIGSIDRASMVEEFFGLQISQDKKQEISALRVLAMQKLKNLKGGELKYAESSYEIREAAVEKVHPGWKTLVRTPVFKTWLKSQPSDTRKLAASDNPDDAVMLLTRYKVSMVEIVHPGWITLVRSTAFIAWLKSQPANTRALGASNDPQDAVMLINAFKKERGG
ncbi:MAG: hypothetical protein EOP06_17585 [Proteobacteria bacterium]|nr:MAG: hypothetical protein EOP06_17585 [Pseudomonadota bacterium]